MNNDEALKNSGYLLQISTSQNRIETNRRGDEMDKLIVWLTMNIVAVLAACLILIGFGFWIGVIWKCFSIGFQASGNLWS